MEFVITITDPLKLAGITAARLAHNEEHTDAPLETDAEYVQYVADKATESYAVQYQAAIEKAMQDDAFAAKLAAQAAE